MAIIEEPIPKQLHQLIGPRIAEILADEIDHQVNVLGAYAPNPFIRYQEYAAKDHTELPLINITTDRGEHIDHDQRGWQRVEYIYNIDCYGIGHADETDTASQKASMDMHRMMGMVRAILMHPSYIQLGFSPGTVATKKMAEFEEGPPQGGEDGSIVAYGRIRFSATVNENTNPRKKANTVDELDTKWKLNETEKGYRWTVT